MATGAGVQRMCPFGTCDGSGWILGEDDVARSCKCRERRIAHARTRGVDAVIPAKYRGVSFDRPPVSTMDRTIVGVIRKYVDNLPEYLSEGRGLWLMGDVGTGKTTLAMLVSKAALESGYSAAIYSLPRLLARIRRTYDAEVGEQGYLDFFERLTSVDLLHLDDVGAEKRTDWVLEQLYAVINERYETGRAILITSNLDQTQLEEQIGSRSVSRLVEMCGQEFMVPMHGTDWRLTA
jgi:DNA replication protein DnaC